ncbi:sensor histidine kinase [Catenovulum adriaticum]|uniref:histidine kinase n=1 Tax=Catenovulum adriaticum TaxID=2984846 RepID=A0ABY7AMX2_9ALTE|nr:HAMP domain-containing sensor histidine kinase [Catenovulum sp. TS8]WAJ70908.1 ATP-binding protein [Catenovulum sp. TS8]
MKAISLSRKLLTQVLTIYIALTVIITAVQIISEYYITKEHIQDELVVLQKTVSSSLTRSIWELNSQQSLTITQGLLAMPVIEGIVLRDENGNIITKLGKYVEPRVSNVNYDEAQLLTTKDARGLFGYLSVLVFEFSGKPVLVGDISLFSSRQVIFDRISVPVTFLLFKAFFITICLFLIILFTFKRLLRQPLYEFTEQIENFDIERLEASKLSIDMQEQNELTILQQAYNKLIDQLHIYSECLDAANKNLLDANTKLDEQNLLLEHQVAKKTSNLSRVLLNIENQKKELEESRNELAIGIETRKQAEHALLVKQSELEAYVQQLKAAQKQLLETEKMSTLGGLVAGITHDVNTPIGISITAASFLSEQVTVINQNYIDKTLTSNSLGRFLQDSTESINLIDANLKRASELINSFKQIAVDQASDAKRDIEIGSYVQEVINSLKPKLKKTHQKIQFHCDAKIKMSCPAGAISQILTNLIMNSIIHGFEGSTGGRIDIRITDLNHDLIQLDYLDNGKGMDTAALAKLFAPFYTTKQNQGGSGLGTHIVYNLVTQTLKGDIKVNSEIGKGLEYVITLPKVTNVD